jgi:anti-sigma regulatory factor (Ser/Thr protein kinase)
MSAAKSEQVMRFHYDVPGDDFTHAGEASGNVKKVLKQLGFSPDVIRRTTISMYEGEINMVIHAGGGEADILITPHKIDIDLIDQGPGIVDVDLAMQEGYSTAPDKIRSLGFGAGMGLPNIKKYTDSLEIETKVGHGTTVHMAVDVHDN